jgi:hypothetical protein
VQLACRDLFDQLLKRRLHEVFRFAGLGGQAGGGGIASIAAKSSKDHLLPTIPVIQTIAALFGAA